MFLLALATKLVVWSWFYDSVFLLVAICLAAGPFGWATSGSATERPGPRPTLALWLCAYLCTDSVLDALALLRSPGLLLLLSAGMTCLSVTALIWRLREREIVLSRFRWKALFEQPALLLTIGTLLPLLCMYMPMLRVYIGFVGWSGPMVVHLPGTVTMDAGHAVRIGGTYLLRGYEVSLGHLVCLLLAFTAMLAVLRMHAMIPAARSLLFSRAAAILILLWWLVPAKGYSSLGNLYNLGFLAGCTLLLVAVFRPSGHGQATSASYSSAS